MKKSRSTSLRSGQSGQRGVQRIEPLTVDALARKLWEEVHKLESGEADPRVSNAIVNASGTILRTVKLRMEYAKLRGQVPNIPLLTDGKS